MTTDGWSGRALLDIADVGDLSLHAGVGRGKSTVSLARLAVQVDVGNRPFDDRQFQEAGARDVLRRHIGARGDEPLVEIEVGQRLQQSADIGNADAAVLIWRCEMIDVLGETFIAPSTGTRENNCSF